jgi:hypothetical protein
VVLEEAKQTLRPVIHEEEGETQRGEGYGMGNDHSSWVGPACLHQGEHAQGVIP